MRSLHFHKGIKSILDRSDFNIMADKNKDTRTRNWSCIVYPESAPENWKSILQECFVPAFISPLHDKDINPEAEADECKKPHYHIVIMFDGPKTSEQAQEIFTKIGGVGCLRVQSIRGMARYLCHLDNPEKYQYSPDDITQLCGADWYDVTNLPIDDDKAVAEMMDFIDSQSITSFSKFFRWIRNNRPEWFRVIRKGSAYLIKEYIKSFTWELRQVDEMDDEADE